MQPQQTNNYDFIMNPAQPARKNPLGGNSTAARLLVLVGGLFLVIAVIVVLMKIIGGSQGLNKPAMLSVAQDQTEIVRLTTYAASNATSESKKNFSLTTTLSVSSQRDDLLAYLAKNHYTVKPKSLMLKHDATVDQQLEAARSSSTFDTAYGDVMKRELTSYQKDLRSAYKTAGPTGKTLLTKQYDQTQLLLTLLTTP